MYLKLTESNPQPSEWNVFWIDECYRLKIPSIALPPHILKKTDKKWIHSLGCVPPKVKFTQAAQLFNHTLSLHMK